MTAPPPDSDPSPDDVDDPGEENPSGKAASSPEEARAAAEEALARVEALADLDEAPESEDTEDTAPTESSGSSDAPPSSEEGPPQDQCPNCGALLEGPYCSQCGQKSSNRIVPVWHMINEALEAVFELDLRVLHTLPKFLFLPGRLTKEYINGRRKRYIRPLRLYLFSTFVLFAVIALTTTGNVGFVLDPQGMARLNPPNTAITASRSTSTASGSSLFGSPEEREKLAKEIASDTSSINVTFFDNPETNQQFEQVLREKIPQAVRNPRDFLGSVIDQGPYLMFLMLPLFALLLKLLYIRRGRLYMEHMIFSLHVHALAFFAFTVGVLLDQSTVGWLNTMAPWIEAFPLLYLVLAMSHVYEQGLLKSILKAAILLLIYTVLLSIGFLGLLFVAVLFM